MSGIEKAQSVRKPKPTVRYTDTYDGPRGSVAWHRLANVQLSEPTPCIQTITTKGQSGTALLAPFSTPVAPPAAPFTKQTELLEANHEIVVPASVSSPSLLPPVSKVHKRTALSLAEFQQQIQLPPSPRPWSSVSSKRPEQEGVPSTWLDNSTSFPDLVMAIAPTSTAKSRRRVAPLKPSNALASGRDDSTTCIAHVSEPLSDSFQSIEGITDHSPKPDRCDLAITGTSGSTPIWPLVMTSVPTIVCAPTPFAASQVLMPVVDQKHPITSPPNDASPRRGLSTLKPCHRGKKMHLAHRKHRTKSGRIPAPDQTLTPPRPQLVLIIDYRWLVLLTFVAGMLFRSLLYS